MNQRKRGILITYCTMVINIIAGFLYTPYMIKHLGASEYGVFSLSNSLISFISLLDLGFNQTMVRYSFLDFVVEYRDFISNERFQCCFKCIWEIYFSKISKYDLYNHQIYMHFFVALFGLSSCHFSIGYMYIRCEYTDFLFDIL